MQSSQVILTPNEQSSQALSSSPYTYQPLPDDHTIRILILNPGEDDDPLSGLIETSRLVGRRQASATPQAMWSADRHYEAISYVWGSNTMDHSIYLDGKIHKITANLSDALHQCRPSDQPRALWADSICIDQADLKEKGHQVALMSRIYSSSQRTLICLGSDPKFRHDAQQAFSILFEANEMIQRTFQNANFTWGMDSFPWPDAGDPLVNDPKWQSIVAMARLEWFKRGWVVQEVALGHEALILWAGFEMLWSVFSRVYAWYIWRVEDMIDFPDSVDWSLSRLFRQAYYYYQSFEAQTFRPDKIVYPGILSVLNAARAMTLSDPRDRIYAFTALPYLKGAVSILEPDYEQSHLDIYQDFAVKYLDSFKDLNLLLCVQHDEQIPNQDRGSSWVPHWDRYAADVNDYSLGSVDGFGDSDTDLCRFTIHESEVGTSPYLQVKAVLFDSIIFASIRLEKISTIEDVAALWQQMKKLCSIGSGQDQCNATIECPNFLEAFANGHYHGSSEREYGFLVNEYANIIDKVAVQESGAAESSNLEIPPSVQYYHQQTLLENGRSKIFLLSRKYFGLGPWIIEEGDICAFIFGVNRPLILRSVPGEVAHHYQVVGPAYVVSKKLGDEGTYFGFDCLDGWNDWKELCESHELRPLDLKVEDIIFR